MWVVDSGGDGRANDRGLDPWQGDAWEIILVSCGCWQCMEGDPDRIIS